MPFPGGRIPHHRDWRQLADSADARRRVVRTQQKFTDRSRVLDSWLAVSAAGGRFCDTRTLLLVDESSQISVRAMHALLTEVERTNAPVLYLGDRVQTLAVPAGLGIDLIARTIEVAEISKIVRQSDPELRVMVEQLAKGDVASAIETMASRGQIFESDGQAATIKAAVDNLFVERAAAPDKSHLLICKSNATRLALDAEVRRRLRVEGVLSGDDVTLNAVTPSGRPYRLSLATATASASASVAKSTMWPSSMARPVSSKTSSLRLTGSGALLSNGRCEGNSPSRCPIGRRRSADPIDRPEPRNLATASPDFQVTVDWPAEIPILERELRAIEILLGNELSDLLADRKVGTRSPADNR